MEARTRVWACGSVHGPRQRDGAVGGTRRRDRKPSRDGDEDRVEWAAIVISLAVGLSGMTGYYKFRERSINLQ
jgi:hypothetical protein